MSEAVAKRSEEAQEMLTASAKGRALMGGTAKMREAGETYLPKFGAESVDAYKARLSASWLFNGYRKTVRDMTGRVFGKPVELTDSPPADLVTWCENVDLAGRDLSTFARAVFEDALSGPGISWVMVDAPRREGTVTLAEAQAQNLRPFLTHLSAEDILGWRSQAIANVQTLTQIRIRECVTQPDPKDEFADIEVKQIRVLDRTPEGVTVRIFREVETQGRKAWVLVDGPYLTGLAEITVVPFYANRDGFFEGEPLLEDLADINIAHWQSQSDQRNILHFARVPILFGAGVEAQDVVIGAAKLITAGDTNAKLSFVEHSGQAIEAGRQDLKDLEFQMEAFGLQLLAPRASAQSATGEALDAAKETSTLAMTADALRDCLEQALGWMCQYGGLGETSVSVTVNDDFGIHPFTAQDVSVLLQAVQQGELSRVSAIEEMKRRGWLRSDIDVSEELARIDADQQGGMPSNDPGMGP